MNFSIFFSFWAKNSIKKLKKTNFEAGQVNLNAFHDEGYTSLGKKSNSVRNEHLKVDVEFGEGHRKECYLPAYCLPSAEFERFKR